MINPQLEKLAELLINHSCSLQKGEKVLIEAFDIPQEMVIATIRAARSAAIFARDGSGIVRIHIQPGEPGVVQVMARVEEVGENTAELNGSVDGGEAKVAFNSKYLQDVLNVIDTELVALEVTTPSSPGVLKPSTHDSYVHVVMPMFVQW